MKKFALITAGGSGDRMESAIPKQFIMLCGKPVLMYTIDAFFRYDPQTELILILPENAEKDWIKMCKEFSFKRKHIVVAGGHTRFHSVKNGLQKIKTGGIVFIHDGVRPLVSPTTIRNCYQTALEKGNALPVISPSESIRQVYNSKNRAVMRDRFFLVQTPQTFDVSLIKKAYNQEYIQKFTDDASVLEQTGQKIHLVEGNRENIKITWPEDFLFATAIVESQFREGKNSLG